MRDMSRAVLRPEFHENLDALPFCSGSALFLRLFCVACAFSVLRVRVGFCLRSRFRFCSGFGACFCFCFSICFSCRSGSCICCRFRTCA